MFKTQRMDSGIEGDVTKAGKKRRVLNHVMRMFFGSLDGREERRTAEGAIIDNRLLSR